MKLKHKKLPRSEHGWIAEYGIVRYAFASQFVKDKIVVDVGCGLDYGASCLLRGNPRMAIGGDISRECIEYAKAFYEGNERLDFLCLDAHSLPFHDESVDVIVSMDVIEHLKGYEGFLSECRRVLSKDGIFICTTPNREVSSPGRKVLNVGHEKEFYIDEFHQLLEKYFEAVDIYGMEPQQRIDKSIYKLGAGIGSRISLYLPWLWRIILGTANYVTRFSFNRYRFVRIEKVASLDFDELDKSHTPFLISSNLIVPRHILGIAYKRNIQ